jgi:hypothetical protein
VLVNAEKEDAALRELPGLVESTPHRREMESVTETNGTVARFEMAYTAATPRTLKFGPPIRQRLPSFVFLALALVLEGVVLATYYGSSHSRLYVWIVEGERALPAPVLAFVVLLSAMGTVLRAQMRGVVVRPDGIEARYLLPLGVPRVRRWVWSQVERIVIDADGGAMLELWNATYERLPDVARPGELAETLARVAGERRIAVTKLESLSRR